MVTRNDYGMSEQQQSFHVGDPGSNPGGDASVIKGESRNPRRSRKRPLPQYNPKSWNELVRRVVARAKPDPASGCLLWTGAADRNGYGRIRYLDALYSSHRVVLEHKLGRKLERWEDTRHACDTPACVREAHLASGDRADNVRDAIERGRHVTPQGWQKGEQGFVRDAALKPLAKVQA